LDFGEELVGGKFPGEKILVCEYGGQGGDAVFVQEFNAIISQSSGEETLEKTGTGLGATVEERVAAADIGLEAVELADAIAEVDDVLFARSATVLVGGAAAEEGAEDAVLHMKHGHVLVEGELQPLGRGFL